MALAIKVYLHRLAGLRPVVHRLRLAEPYLYNDLRQSVEKLAGGNVRNLRWRDDEKDLVTLKDDDDLRLASDFVKEQGQSLLRVYADVDSQVFERHRSAADFVTEGAEMEDNNHDDGSAPEGEVKEKKAQPKTTWPVRDLPGGGKYSGYIRTTGADGKAVERELTVDEAEGLVHSGRHYGHSLLFPTSRRPFLHPLGLTFYF